MTCGLPFHNTFSKIPNLVCYNNDTFISFLPKMDCCATTFNFLLAHLSYLIKRIISTNIGRADEKLHLVPTRPLFPTSSLFLSIPYIIFYSTYIDLFINSSDSRTNHVENKGYFSSCSPMSRICLIAVTLNA